MTKDEASRDSYIDEPEEHEETPDELKEEMDIGEKEEDVYTEEGREQLVEDDELEPWEAGYAEGAKGDETLLCDNCRKILGRNPIEKRINGEMHWFCSDKCLKEFEARH